MNISKQTTRAEMISFDGLDVMEGRYQAINLSGGQTNSLEFCNIMFDMPSLDELSALYDDHTST